MELTLHQWSTPILPRHREVEPLLWCFQRILSGPTRVTRDSAVSTTRCFYGSGFVPEMLVKIVVDYPPDDPSVPLFTPVIGKMLTVFLATSYKSTEVRLWP